MTQRVVDMIQRRAHHRTPGRIISLRETTRVAIMERARRARVTVATTTRRVRATAATNTRRVRATAITLRVNHTVAGPCSGDSLKKPFLASLAVD